HRHLSGGLRRRDLVGVVLHHHRHRAAQLPRSAPNGPGGRTVSATHTLERGGVPTHHRGRQPRRRPRGAGTRLWEASPLTYLALVITIVLSIFPIVWAFLMATRENSALYRVPPPFLPGGELANNVSRVLAAQNGIFVKGLINSAIVASTITVSVIFFSSLAGFAFAKLKFKGRNILLLSVVATMMVPTQLAIV